MQMLSAWLVSLIKPIVLRQPPGLFLRGRALWLVGTLTCTHVRVSVF